MLISTKFISSAAGLILLLTGCGESNGGPQMGSTTPEASAEQASQSKAGELGEQAQADQSAKDEAMAASEKAYKSKAAGASAAPPPSQFRFPNSPEPEQRISDYLNFYRINDHYPTYLLCQYQIRKENYSQSDEAGWFQAALGQIRESSQTNFPPLQWVAVIVVNSTDWESGGAFDQAYKVGSVFKASDVFNPSCDLSQLVAHADMDRHPFKYDTSQPTPGDQQRWMIVERHAVTNNPTAVTK